METLDQIALRTGTDKSSAEHGYTKVYEDLFARLKSEPISLLELGVQGGRSISMWLEYFDRARITGVDLSLANATILQHTSMSSYKLYEGDCTKAVLLTRIAQERGPFDIIIDDASHVWKQTCESSVWLWQYLKPGGFYIIEDMHTMFWESHNTPEDLNSFYGMVCGAVLGHGKNPKDYRYELESATLRPGLCILRKVNHGEE